MAVRRFATIATILCVGSLAFACSSQDPGAPLRPYQPSTQTTATPTHTATGTPSTPTTPPEDRPPAVDTPDASVSPTPTPDAGTVTAKDSAAPPAQLGSCQNPACASGGGQCGCRATDNTGTAVYLGCNAGGLCGCFVGQQTQSDGFDENGACSDPAALKALFVANCTCP